MKLTWIPWDHNETLQTGNQGGALAPDFSNIPTGSWTLIEKIYADEIHRAQYDAYLLEVISGPFATSVIQALYDNYALFNCRQPVPWQHDLFIGVRRQKKPHAAQIMPI